MQNHQLSVLGASHVHFNRGCPGFDGSLETGQRVLRATAENPPMGGRFDSGGRDVLVKWLAGFPNNVPYHRIRNTVYGVIQVNNIAKAGTPSGSGYQWTAFDAPQVVVRWHDGHTGRLLYAEGISLAKWQPESRSPTGETKE